MFRNVQLAFLASLLTAAVALPGAQADPSGNTGCLFPNREALETEASQARLGADGGACQEAAAFRPNLANLLKGEDPCGTGVPHASASAHWSYEVAGTVRDPLVPGTYYPAAWTWSYYYLYDKDDNACYLSTTACTITVGNASEFHGVEGHGSPRVSMVVGQYVGVPVHGGGFGCFHGSANVRTYLAGVIPLSGST